MMIQSICLRFISHLNIKITVIRWLLLLLVMMYQLSWVQAFTFLSSQRMMTRSTKITTAKQIEISKSHRNLKHSIYEPCQSFQSFVILPMSKKDSMDYALHNDSNNNHDPMPVEVPQPTEAGGYTHTTASKAKISAANKGKTPWNKGKQRSEEVKQRIAEGVRRRNREKHLLKLQEMGVTEQEYEAKKKEERRIKDAERRSRLTDKGGYRPTEETKAKISQILKEKFAKGEIKKREYNGPFRKGFSHSQETRMKISESLKKKWAEDPAYQQKMRNLTDQKNQVNAREKISKTLKDKWKDPVFRQKMIDSMKNRKLSSASNSKGSDYRAKISTAMKKKWEDSEYREKAITGILKYREKMPPKKKSITKTTIADQEKKTETITAVKPMTSPPRKMLNKQAKQLTPSISSSTTSLKKHRTSTPAKKDKSETITKKQNSIELVKSAAQKTISYSPPPEEKALSDDGDISRMREERRDLYDLLYGDDGDVFDDDIEMDSDNTSSTFTTGTIDIDSAEEFFDDTEKMEMSPSSLSFFSSSAAYLEDDNLDDFDPYNLSDY